MPLVSMWCFLLDGIFVGATKGKIWRHYVCCDLYGFYEFHSIRFESKACSVASNVELYGDAHWFIAFVLFLSGRKESFSLSLDSSVQGAINRSCTGKRVFRTHHDHVALYSYMN